MTGASREWTPAATRVGEATREPFRGWYRKSWVPPWLWRLVADISTHDATILAIERAESEMIERLRRGLYS